MTNRGTKTWSTSHRLGSQNPADNYIWGTHRVYLTNNVSPGSEVTFNFTVTAPTTPGTYNFQWRMLEEMVEWFGDFTPNVAITVEAGTVLTPELTNVGHGFFNVAKHEGTGEMWAGTFGDQGGGTSARLYVKRNGSWQLHSDFSSYAESIYRLIYHPGTNKLYANMEVWTKNPSIFRLDGDTWVSTGYGHQYAESPKTMGIGMGLGADGYIYATTMPIAELNKGYIWRSLDGVNWNSFPDPGVGNVIAHYYTFNGQTYAVTSFGGGNKKLLRLNGTTWETLYSNANLMFYYLIEFKGALYMSGEDMASNKAVIYRWNGTSCQQVYAAGTGTTEAFFQQMAKVKDASNVEWLYAGYSVGWRLNGDSSVHRSYDGTTWGVYQTFPGEGECWAVGTGETDHTLYVGTKNQGGGGRMYGVVFSTPAFHAFPAGWNMISLPFDPVNPDPKEVFKDKLGNPINIGDNFYRYDHNSSIYIPYSESTAEEFGLCKRGDGYWLNLLAPTTVSYQGVGSTEPLTLLLPTKSWYMIGIYNIEEELVNIQIKNNATSQTLPFSGAVNAGWIDSILYGWYPPELRYWEVSLDGPPINDASVVKPWGGYWICTNIDGLELIFP
jgi:hypothetical protein